MAKTYIAIIIIKFEIMKISPLSRWMTRFMYLVFLRRSWKFDSSRAFNTSLQCSVDWRKVRLGNVNAAGAQPSV